MHQLKPGWTLQYQSKNLQNHKAPYEPALGNSREKELPFIRFICETESHSEKNKHPPWPAGKEKKDHEQQKAKQNLKDGIDKRYNMQQNTQKKITWVLKKWSGHPRKPLHSLSLEPLFEKKINMIISTSQTHRL